MQSGLISVAVFVFELEEVVAAAVEHRLSLGFVVVEGVAGDGRVVEVSVIVEPQGDRLFASREVVAAGKKGPIAGQQDYPTGILGVSLCR